KAIGRMLPTAVLVIAIIIGVCAGFGILLSELTGVSELDAYLATTPGGLYAVLATSADTGGNVTFVTAVQLIRLLLVLIAAPLIATWFAGRKR
ncbi:MAG: AbrB family transcriptional regulator, partial [Aeromicrobium sp.]